MLANEHHEEEKEGHPPANLVSAGDPQPSQGPVVIDQFTLQERELLQARRRRETERMEQRLKQLYYKTYTLNNETGRMNQRLNC